MFQFSVHKFKLSELKRGNPQENGFGAEPSHLITLDYPEGQSIRVDRHATNTNEFRISSNLGNDQDLRVRQSVQVWCGDIEVCDIKHREAIVDAHSWIQLCVVDLNESLNDMEDKGGDAFLRVSLNVVVNDDDMKKILPRHGEHSIVRMTEQPKKRSRLCDLLAWQLFWFIAAKLIESQT
mmetsp:Transcript_33673/g.81409  ORF Transcript_33673/g.81409 Transcript_33673/m.81409 type:complete len:180 (+) Transcript_33673:2638-3177(+)